MENVHITIVLKQNCTKLQLLDSQDKAEWYSHVFNNDKSDLGTWAFLRGLFSLERAP
jgi:hypothetical protein